MDVQDKDESEIGPSLVFLSLPSCPFFFPGVQAGSGEVRSACWGGFERDLECIVLCIL